MRYLGCHVSASGGLENALSRGDQLNVNTIQIHPSPPQRWNTTPYKDGYEEKFLKQKKTSKVEKIFFHSIYLINLATPNDKNLEQSINSLIYYLELSAKINGEGVIFHVGSLKDEPDQAQGLSRAAKAVEKVLTSTPGNSRLMMEVSAGSGKVIGSKFEDLRKIYDQIKDTSRLGFALDTQHMWASGYDIKEQKEKVLSQIEDNFGREKVWAIHVNDSKSACASGIDRHENIGKGLIGAEALLSFINSQILRDIPLILETPDLKDESTAINEVVALKELINR
jgi:apurinic endonuclease APN1